MEILRSAANPWGQNILVGVAWDLLWAAAFVGVVFVVIHALYVAIMAPPRAPKQMEPAPAGIPDRVVRHSASSRAFHWLMAASMLTLLVTAFFPLIGIQFAWVTIHWIAGIVLTLLIVYHIVVAMKKWRTVWIGSAQITEAKLAVGRFFRRERAKADRSAKYPIDQRAYHNAATLVSLGAIVTGILMMFRIDTWFWASNPYFLADSTWGLVFVLHGLCGVALITLVIAHIYFAVRPEKRWMTRSMIKGWITKEEYLDYYDPAQWPLDGEPVRVASHDSGDSEAVASA